MRSLGNYVTVIADGDENVIKASGFDPPNLLNQLIH